MVWTVVRDTPLIVFKNFCCSLVFNFNFYFLQRYCLKVAPFYDCCWSPPNLLQGVGGYWQLSGKFATGCQRCLQPSDSPQRALATLPIEHICPRNANHFWSFARRYSLPSRDVTRGYRQWWAKFRQSDLPIMIWWSDIVGSSDVLNLRSKIVGLSL